LIETYLKTNDKAEEFFCFFFEEPILELHFFSIKFTNEI